MRRKPIAALLRRHLNFPTRSTIPQLARRIGIDVRTLRGALMGGVEPNRHTLERLSRFLGIPVSELKNRPGSRVKAHRMKKSSERAKLLAVTGAEHAELLRLAELGRAHAINEAPSTIDQLANRVNDNLATVFDGRIDVSATVTAADHLEPTMAAFVRRLRARPPVLVYLPRPVNQPRYGKRGQEALSAIALGIINSGWSCIVLLPVGMMTSEVFACWPAVDQLPALVPSQVYRDLFDWICDQSARDGLSTTVAKRGTGSALRQCIDDLRRISVQQRHGGRHFDQSADAVNQRNASIVAATLRRLLVSFVGSSVDGEDGHTVTLHFRDSTDRQPEMNAFWLCGQFTFCDGSCTIFTVLDISGDDIRVQIAVRSLQSLALHAETRLVAEHLMNALDELARVGNDAS